MQGGLRFLRRYMSNHLSWSVWGNNFFLWESTMIIIFYPIFSSVAICMYFIITNIIFAVSLFFPSVVPIYLTNYIITALYRTTDVIVLFFLPCIFFSTLDTFTSILEIHFPLYNLFLSFVKCCNSILSFFFALLTWFFIDLLYDCDF